MKKLIALVIAAMMVLSLVPVMTFGVSAANEWDEWNIPNPDKDSFWTTYRNIVGYNLAEGESYNPTAGYKYTSEGFQTISPDFTGSSPQYIVSSSDPIDISEGFYMQVRIDEFPYKGEDGKADEWISFFISDTPTLSPPSVEYGNYWCSLIRGAGDGTCTLVSHLAVANTNSEKGDFKYCGEEGGVAVPKDNDGKEVYEFAVIPQQDGSYDVQINGKTVKGCADDVSPAISKYGQCYIGIIPMSSVANGKAQITILKQGSSKEDAEPLTIGPDKTPELNSTTFAEIADPSTVPANTPALLFDGSGKTTYKNPSGVNCALSMNADGTWKLTATSIKPYFMWSIKNEISYEAKDFPVFGMMLKNYIGEDGLLYYCAGDILAPSDEHKLSWSPWDLYESYDDDGNPVPPTAREYKQGEDRYLYITVDVSQDEDWAGRIRGMRPDFDTNAVTGDELLEFDINFMGMFRSAEEAFAYSDKYITELGGSTVEQTTAESKPEGDSSADSTTDESVADTAKTTTATTEAVEEGCASVVGMASVALLTAAAAAAVALKKKH